MDVDASTYTKIFETKLGPLGFGAAPLGNLYASVTDEDAADALMAAERLGVNWFDVAPLYGFGLAEQRLGRFLRQPGPRRVISTKV
jgi:D-threo-aldose 1-dehydrogenase